MARYSLAIWTPLPGIGSYSEGPFKVVHHTTQGSTVAGAIASYRQTGSYPHFTIDGDAVYQHVDTNIAVSRLEHKAGTIETNRSHAIQIELVGFAEQSKSRKSLATVAALCRWLEQQHNIAPVWPNGVPYPPVNGHEPDVPFNRSEANWRQKGGHYGHCHVPNNHHWDPGYTADEVALVMEGAAADVLSASSQDPEPESLPPMAPSGQSEAPPAPLTPYVQSLVKLANGEYEAFHTISEMDEPLRSRIDTYCHGIGIAPPAEISNFAWSAAFVSWCVKKAGATAKEFAFSPTPAVFVREAIANADAQIGVFRARRIGSYAPQVGDLIHRNRSGGTISYDEARTSSQYPSQIAIVVELGEDHAGRFAMTVGGKERDSIRMTRVALDGAGMVAQKAGDPFICVVQDLKVDVEAEITSHAEAGVAAASQRLQMAETTGSEPHLRSGDDQLQFDAPPISDRNEPEAAAASGTERASGDGVDGFDAPDGTAIRDAAADFYQPEVPFAESAGPGSISPDVVAMHRTLERRLFARRPEMALAAAASDDPPTPREMIVGVGIGAAHRDFESVGPAGPGAPVLNVYVTEPMNMEQVKRVLVDHYEMGQLASDRQPVNVHHCGPISALAHMHRERPSPCGISVGHYKTTAGTQGVLARGIAGSGREGRLLIVSNNHVLANANDCQAGDPIHQPGPMDLRMFGFAPSAISQIGILERWVPLNFFGDNFVDCATAWCFPGNVNTSNFVRREFIQQRAGQWSYFNVSANPVAAVQGLPVGKSGRTTQLSSGRVLDINASISVIYAGRVARFRDQITIAGADGRAFSSVGDSGSLIWTWDQNRSPVGLLFAGGRDYTFANKIHHVLQALQIELYT